MNIIKTDTAIIPRYADNGAAGMDLFIDPSYSCVIKPGDTWTLPTGISVEIPRLYFGAIYPRSSLHRKGLTLANTVGIIDSSYRGQIYLALTNILQVPIEINPPGSIPEAVCQLVIQPYRYEPIHIVESLSETSRGTGGFGSTDRKKQKQKYTNTANQQRYRETFKETHNKLTGTRKY